MVGRVATEVTAQHIVLTIFFSFQHSDAPRKCLVGVGQFPEISGIKPTAICRLP
jgi:hypothetical protein